MTCYKPIRACYHKGEYLSTGKKHIHLCFTETYDQNTKRVIKDDKWILNEKSFPHGVYEYINLPCGKCPGCRSDHAKMWSLRAYHELYEHDKSCFVTLTYDDRSDLVQKDPLCTVSLRYKHFQNFMKRLRKEFPDRDIRYIVCGEYGLKDSRSHWHCILYGIDFSEDRVLHHKYKGYDHFSSQTLQRLWSTYDNNTKIFTPIGFVDLANVDYDCCAYVSGYVLKKLDVGNVEPVVGHYYDDDGVLQDKVLSIEGRCPEIIRTSRRPAIGKRWFDKYGFNAVERGFAYVKKGSKSLKIKIPRYYQDKFEQLDPERFEVIKSEKEKKMKKYYKRNPVDYDKLNSWCEGHLYRIKNKLKECLTIFN